MAYLPPSVQLREEFLALASTNTQVLNAAIVGPNYRVFSYENTLDRPLIGLGSYDHNAGGIFSYPGLADGSVVNQSSVTLTLDTVLAQFGTLSGAGVVAKSSSVQNEIILGNNADGAFQANTSSTRLTALGNRDLKIGDKIKITGGTSGASVTTNVLGFSQNVIASNAGNPTAGSSNQAVQTKSVTVTTVTANGDHAVTEYTTGGTYVGNLQAGILSDTYTLTCTSGGTGTAAVFSVTSLKGDNVSSINAPALSGHIPVGANGLAVTFSGTGAYVTGESYTIATRAAIVAQTPSIVGNNYTGSASTTYQVKVVRGGTWTQGPVISVSSLNGVDYQTPQTIAYNTSFPLGSLGLTAKFNTSTTQNGLVTGDTYLVVVTAASAGAVTGLYTSDPLPSNMTTNEDLSLVFYLAKSSVTLPATGYPNTGTIAMVVEDSEVTISPNLQIVDSQFIDNVGNFIPLNVISANLYLNYSTLLTDQSGVFQTLSDLGSVEAILGRAEIGNPLSYAVYKALLNSNGQAVNFVSIDQDNLQGYTDALATLEKNELAYFCVPATDDLSVRQLFLAHVLAMSDEAAGLERIAICSLPVSPTVSLFDAKTDGSHWTAYVVANPASQVTVYTKLTMPGATFLGSGVRAGDQVRTNYALDASGALTFQTAKVATVLDNQNLLLSGSGFGVLVGSSSQPVRTAIIRVLTRDELATQAATLAGAFGNRRFFAVLPNRDPSATVDSGAEPIWAYAAEVAGLKSGVAPHQGITNAVLNASSENLQYFTPAQLNVIAGGGVMVINQDAPGGAIYVRHQLSTDMTDSNTQEMSIAVNTDAILKFIRVDLKPFLGRYNNTVSLDQLVFTLIAHKFDVLATQTITPTAGPQVTSFDPKDLTVSVDPVTRTLLNVAVSFGEPYPCNNIKGTLTVV